MNVAHLWGIRRKILLSSKEKNYWIVLFLFNLFIFLICVCCRYDNVPPEINRLRCRVNYHALKFLPEIEEMSDLLVSRMRNRTGISNPFMYVTL